MIKNCQTGRTMIEMLGVLAVIGVISVAGYNLFSKAARSRKIGEIKSNVTILAMQSRRLACQYVERYGSYTKMLSRAKAYPEVLEYNPNSVKYVGESGEEYKIDSVTSGGRKNAFFTIKISRLSDEACMSLVTGNFGSTETNGFYSVTLNNTQLENHPVTVAVAKVKCVNDNNEIVLKYRACENNASGLY